MKLDVEMLLELAAGTRPERREELLERECPDPAVRRELVASLQYADDAESFFDRAIQGVAASLETLHEPSPGDLLGSYRIVSLIDRGGMGSIYLAERADDEIKQNVAIKLLRADANRPGWRERFLKERQLLATLHHPSIVHVIDAGHTDDGRPFLVMEHVEGVPIDRYAADIAVQEPAETVPANLRRRVARAPALDHSSRSEAIEYSGECVRATEVAGLRHCQTSERHRRRYANG